MNYQELQHLKNLMQSGDFNEVMRLIQQALEKLRNERTTTR